MAKNTENTIKVDVMGLDNLMDILETIRQRLDEHDTRLDAQDERLNVIGSLAVSCSNRITALEKQLAALEPQGDPCDIRDALMRDALTPLWTFPDGGVPNE